MNLIVVVDENWGIGKNGKLLFDIPADMKYFRENTMGKVMVMGENTLKSLPGGRPLKGRVNIVLSDDPEFTVDGAAVCRSMGGLFEEIAKYDTKDVFVIGGASMYNQLMDRCDTAHVTRVAAVAGADVFIHPLDGRPGWRLAESSDVHEENGLKFTFNVYVNEDVKTVK